MGHQVALSFEDGVTRSSRSATTRPSSTPPTRRASTFPSDCRDGACGTCKAFCDSGSFDPGDFIDDAMTEEELEKGYLLTCQAVPESDLAIQIPATSESAKTSAATYTSTSQELDKHSETTISFTLDVENREALAFLPGPVRQHQGPRNRRRALLLVQQRPRGAGRVLHGARHPAGCDVRVPARPRARWATPSSSRGPYGSFFLREPKRPLLLLAGGTGLAPLLSILEKLAENPPSAPRST